jgi:ATP/maltotriose-dependent transcriptional regulator MalT
MGEREVGGGGKGGSAPTTGKEAEMEAIRQSYAALAKQITREIVVQSRWKMLSTDELDLLRNALNTALSTIDDRI